MIVKVVAIGFLFVLVQSLRRLANPANGTTGSNEWADLGIQLLVAPVLFYIVVSWRWQWSHLIRSSSKPTGGNSVTSVFAGIGAGAVIGGILFLFLAAFVMWQHPYDFGHNATKTKAVSFLMPAVIVPVVEEVYFRAVLLASLCQSKLSAVWAVILNALFFAIVHHYSVAPFLFAVGLAAGWLFLRFGLVSSVVMHMVYNAMIVLYSNYV